MGADMTVPPMLNAPLQINHRPKACPQTPEHLARGSLEGLMREMALKLGLQIIAAAFFVLVIVALWEVPFFRMVMSLCLAIVVIGLVKAVVFRIANGRWQQPSERD
jgi:hypothetical protein